MANLHNDEPTLNDELGRAELVRRVSNAVARCSPPQVFGVHGDWGTDKTSFLHQLHWDLVGECPQQPDLAEVAIRSALLSLEDLTKRIGIQASKIQEAGERWEEENLATRLPAHMIRQHLEDALRKLLP